MTATLLPAIPSAQICWRAYFCVC